MNIEIEKQLIEQVKRDPLSLRYVKEQTEAICLAAVKQNGYCLRCFIFFNLITKEFQIAVNKTLQTASYYTVDKQALCISLKCLVYTSL